MKIDDGTGKGYQLGIDKDNRAQVNAVVEEDLATTSREEGQAYVVGHSGFISITTTGTETGILHIKNTSTTKIFEIHSIRTCGDQVQKWKLYKNSTGGTLITGATAGTVNNLNITSTNEAELTVYKGADGVTLSGGTMIGHHINAIGHGSDHFGGALIIGQGDSLELTVEVASAASICCRIIGHFHE